MTHTAAPHPDGFSLGGSRGRKNEDHTHLLETAGSAVSIQGVTKQFGDFTAVQNLDLEIREGEFFSMLGPSGSGKTTVLRMIAGFEPVTTGSILLHGEDVTAAAPFDRAVNTVFQDYALFPHLSIAQNVAYGLKVRRIPQAEQDRLVGEALEQVQLSHVADRRPSQLSGGQRQRIALARALILRPKVLLLDEPLGALDKQLREQMQIELKQIQREVGITFVFVTHDQEEALTLSDRIAVFNAGTIEQIGSPRAVYEFPETEFVARFLGVTNVIPPEVSQQYFGSAFLHSLRPERVILADPTAPLAEREIAIAGEIAEVIYAGAHTRFLVNGEDGLRYIAEQQNRQAPSTDAGIIRGERVSIRFQHDHATAIPGTAALASAA